MCYIVVASTVQKFRCVCYIVVAPTVQKFRVCVLYCCSTYSTEV